MDLRYEFELEGGTVVEFAFNLDGEDLSLIVDTDRVYPEWTDLGYHQCPNCPLEAARHRRCPVARNLFPVIERFREAHSFEMATVAISTPERCYLKQTTLQKAIGSLMGVIMVTSGCPVLDHLRPMVLSHLPFASRRETVYRLLSMYLLAQYFKKKTGIDADWEMTDLLAIFREIQIVNEHLLSRLNSLGIEDACLNAVTGLNSFTDIASLLLEEGTFDEFEKVFRSYTRPGPVPPTSR